MHEGLLRSIFGPTEMSDICRYTACPSVHPSQPKLAIIQCVGAMGTGGGHNHVLGKKRRVLPGLVVYWPSQINAMVVTGASLPADVGHTLGYTFGFNLEALQKDERSRNGRQLLSPMLNLTHLSFNNHHST